MEVYNSSGYGAYHKSKFMIELNRTVVIRGDFHRYISSDITDYILNPRSTREDIVHIFSEDDIIDETPKNNDQILKSMYTIFHEATHFIQDLTLGSEILRDSLYDGICARSLEFIKSSEKNGTRISLPSKQLTDCSKREMELYNKIYKGFIQVDMKDDKLQIGTDDLVEAYAAAKAFYYMIEAEPESVRNNRMNIFFHNSQMRDTYRKVWSVFTKKLAFVKEPYSGDSLCRKQSLDMIAFLFICDIALHIPATVMALSADECEVTDYALPYIRFRRIVETLIQNEGYPDAVEGEAFYITLFNFIAKRNGWPTFQETNDSWGFFLERRMQHGFMVSDGYRMFGLHYKNNNANRVILEQPGVFFRKNHIPILVRYYKGNDSFFEYVCLSPTSNAIWMDSSPINPLRDPYKIMKNEAFRNPWTADSFLDEISKKNGHLWPCQTHPTFLREIFCRILSKGFFREVQGNKDFFSCPLADLRCLSKIDACCGLHDFTKLPERCCLAIWMKDCNISPDSIYWR